MKILNFDQLHKYIEIASGVALLSSIRYCVRNMQRKYYKPHITNWATNRYNPYERIKP